VLRCIDLTGFTVREQLVVIWFNDGIPNIVVQDGYYLKNDELNTMHSYEKTEPNNMLKCNALYSTVIW
jgi:spore cortex formation protein SpoVR/YcgB (stage V sporulation)